MTHPYADLPDRAFWRRGVTAADRNRFDGLYQPRIAIGPDTRIATAGSCFAQHIGRRLKQAGCAVQDAEAAPELMSDAVAHAYGYRLFSGRYGNIYTSRQLRELLDDVIGGRLYADHVWQKGDGFVDAFRPTVEPDGLPTAGEVLLHRAFHLERIAQMLGKTQVFVFTLGLTESWRDKETGRVFPVCPGVSAGTFDPDKHEFVNFRYGDILNDLKAIRMKLQRFRRGMKLLLTVSPVPLTATLSGDHVLTATSASKAILRAAVDEFVKTTPGTDYFPAYEIVTHPASGGPWFEPNLRSVSPAGVDKVMDIFLRAHGITADAVTAPVDIAGQDSDDGVVCDELLLQAFSR